MPLFTRFLKDPDARLDYQFDWSRWLQLGEQVTVATVVSDKVGLTVEAPPTIAGSTVTAWISGGALGESYRVTCHATTNQGRIDDRSILIEIGQR